MNYQIGNYYGNADLKADGTLKGKIRVEQLVNFLCAGGYKWGKQVLFDTIAEATAYIQERNPQQHVKWGHPTSYKGTPIKSMLSTIEDESDWDLILTPFAETNNK